MSTKINARRLISRRPRHVKLESFDLGPVPDDGILVQNEYTAVSVGTELYSFVHGHEWGRPENFPCGTGYCSAGKVLEAGKDVSSVQPGDRVACQGNHASHEVRCSLYHRIPDNVSTRHAAFLVMAAISMHGIRRARVELGHSVAILGLGLVGQFATGLARLAGAAPLIVIDRDRFRLEKAKQMGAEFCFNPDEENDLVKAVHGLCPEDGVNILIEATGIPSLYPLAVKLPCTAGRLIALGSPRGTVEMSFFEQVHLREVDVIGAFHPITPEDSHLYYPWTKYRDRKFLLELMTNGDRSLPVEPLITHVAQPETCQEIYNMLADDPSEALGVLFDWTA